MSEADAAPLFDPSVKKKKKSSSKSKSLEELKDVAEGMSDMNLDDGAAAGADGEFVFAKKKKKKPKAAATAQSFDLALQKAGVDASGEADAKGSVDEIETNYERLLSRFFGILRENNPEMASDRSGIRYKIPPPIVLRDGNKKTLFANVKLIADKLHRPPEHVIHYLFTELGTSGSVDGTQRLVIKGRFQQQQIQSLLRRYIIEYVTCKTCKSVNTSLIKENRLYFLVCNSCGSRRSVQSIKAGYQAVTRRSRRMAK